MYIFIATISTLICTTTAACKDTGTYCATWATNGECIFNPTYMAQSCAQTCNTSCHCADSHAVWRDMPCNCLERAQSGNCESKAKQMASLCNYTCTLRLESMECNETFLGPVNNAAFSFSGIRFPDTGRYLCDSGYRTTDTTAKGLARCDNDGVWVRSAYYGHLPDCKEIACPAPPLVANATYTPTENHTLQTVVVFTCDIGFDMTTGHNQLICNGTGEWGGDTPTCTAIPTTAAMTTTETAQPQESTSSMSTTLASTTTTKSTTTTTTATTTTTNTATTVTTGTSATTTTSAAAATTTTRISTYGTSTTKAATSTTVKTTVIAVPTMSRTVIRQYSRAAYIPVDDIKKKQTKAAPVVVIEAPGAKAIGSLALILVLCELATIILLDISNLHRDLGVLKRNICYFFERRYRSCQCAH